MRWFLLFVISFFVAKAAIAKPNEYGVIIDPGHGGVDRGATKGDLYESDITLRVSKLLKERLNRHEGIRALLTRDSDEFVSLEKRSDLANQPGHLFLSIHVNSSEDTRAKGHEIYFQNQLPSDEESLFLASRENQGSSKKARDHSSLANPTKISAKNLHPDVHAIVEDLERNHRLKLSGLLAENIYAHWPSYTSSKRNVIRQAPFYVITNVNKPAVLIEIGFLTNHKENEKLKSDVYLDQIAQGISTAVITFKEVMDKSPGASLN